MVDLQYLEQQILSHSINDIKYNYEKDPLGCSLYLYFFLKNNRYDSVIDNLVDWMNTWIDKIIIKKELTRFVDREITSSLMAYKALYDASKLQKSITKTDLNMFLSKYIVNNKFFSDFSFSTVILFSLSDMREDLEFWESPLNSIKEEMKLSFTFNDSKNLVFTSMLFNSLNDTNVLEYITNVAIDRLKKNEYPPSDAIYYAWTLWHNREFSKQTDYSTIINFVEITVNSIFMEFSDKLVDESILEQFGRKSTSNVSRLMTSLTLDLLISFNQERIGIPTFSRSFIEKELEKRGWNGTWLELLNAEKAFDEGKTNDCCRDLRTALIRHMIEVARLFDNSISFPEGKTPDPKIPKKILETNGLSESTSAFFGYAWTFLSERSHTETTKSNQVDPDEARLGFQLTYPIIEFLLRFTLKKNK